MVWYESNRATTRRTSGVENGFPTGPKGIGCELDRDIMASVELNFMDVMIAE